MTHLYLFSKSRKDRERQRKLTNFIKQLIRRIMQLGNSGHTHTDTPLMLALFWMSGLGFPQETLATLEKPSKMYYDAESSRTLLLQT